MLLTIITINSCLVQAISVRSVGRLASIGWPMRLPMIELDALNEIIVLIMVLDKLVGNYLQLTCAHALFQQFRRRTRFRYDMTRLTKNPTATTSHRQQQQQHPLWIFWKRSHNIHNGFNKYFRSLRQATGRCGSNALDDFANGSAAQTENELYSKQLTAWNDNWNRYGFRILANLVYDYDLVLRMLMPTNELEPSWHRCLPSIGDGVAVCVLRTGKFNQFGFGRVEVSVEMFSSSKCPSSVWIGYFEVNRGVKVNNGCNYCVPIIVHGFGSALQMCCH